MHRTEDALYERCAACGVEVLPTDRTYVFELYEGESALLCYACCVSRGGSRDELHDRWVHAPSVLDLAKRPSL
jgi:hypothetical protein